MRERGAASADDGVDVYVAACRHCAAPVDIDLRAGTVSSGHQPSSRISYVDTNVVVWACPCCHQPNSDFFIRLASRKGAGRGEAGSGAEPGTKDLPS